MPNSKIALLVLSVILVTSYLTLAIYSGLPKSLSKLEIETAVNQASHLYKQEKAKGRDFSDGPCLSDALLPDWVVDIVHKPRIPTDDLPENQCPGYLQGRSKHFVELDLLGNVIRVK